MWILKFDAQKYEIDEIVRTYDYVQDIVGEGNLIMIPMDMEIYSHCDVEELERLKKRINWCIERVKNEDEISE